MAVQVGSLFASLTLESAQFSRGMAQAERTTASAMGSIQRQAGITSRAVSGIGKSLSQPIKPYSLIAVSRAFDNTADRANLLRGSLIATTAVFGGFAAALTSNVILRYADTYTQLNNQLRVVSSSTDDLRNQFAAVEAVAERSRAGLKETAVLYSRLAKAAPDLDASSILRYTETVQKALQLGGATTQEASSAAIQFSQAIASNRLGGEELRAILETPLGLALADGLGVTIGKLRELSKEGKLTSEVVLGALEKIAPRIDKQFSRSVRTLDQAITQADNEFTAYIGKVNESYGITQTLGDAILGVSGNLDTLGSVAGTVAPVVASVFAGKLVGGAARRQYSRITGAFEDIKKKANDAFTAAQKDVAKFTDNVAAAKKELNALQSQITTAPIAAFADKGASKAAARELEQIKRLNGETLRLNQDVRKSYEDVFATSAQVSPKMVRQTEAVAEAQAKLNALLVEQQRLNEKAAAKAVKIQPQTQFDQRLGGAAGLDKIKEEGNARARLNQQIAAAEQQVFAARAQLSQRAEALTASEIAAATAAAEKRIAIVTRIKKAEADLAAVRVKADAAQARYANLVSARDSQGAANAAVQVGALNKVLQENESKLISARAALAKASTATSGLATGFSLVRAAGTSLVGFLGGGWGIAFTAAIGLMTALGIKAASTADRIRKVQELNDQFAKQAADADAGAKIDINAGAAQKSADALAERIDAQKETIRIATEELLSAGAAIDASLNETFDSDFLNTGNGAVKLFTELRAQALAGDISVAELERRVRDFIAAKGIGTPAALDRIFAPLKEIRDDIPVLKKATQELERLQKAAGRTGIASPISELDRELALRRRINQERNAPQVRVNSRGLELQTLEELTAKEARIVAIRDQILAEEVKAETVITEKLKASATERATQIDLLRQMKGADFGNGAETFPQNVGLFGDIRRLVEGVKDGSIAFGNLKAEIDDIARRRGIGAKAEELRQIVLQADYSAEGLQKLKTALDDFGRANGVKQQTTALQEMRAEMALIRKERAADQAQQGRVTSAANDLRALELMSDQEKRVQQIKQDILSGEVAAGNTVTAKLEKLAEDRARQIELLQRINQQTSEVSLLSGNFAAAAPVQSSNVRSLDSQASLVAESERVRLAYELREAIRSTSAEIQQYKVGLAELAAIDIGSLFPAEKARQFGPQINLAQQALQELVRQFVNGDIKSGMFVDSLERIRKGLESIGAEGILDGLIRALVKAGFTVDGLGTKLSNLKAAQNRPTLNIPGAGEQQVNGNPDLWGSLSPEEKKLAGGIERNLADIAREQNRAREAMEAAASRAEAQRSAMIDEQRNTVRNITTLGGVFSAAARSFGISQSREQYTSTIPTTASMREKRIAELNAEQSLLQADLQYKQLSPEKMASTERSIAAIGLAIAELTYQQQPGVSSNRVALPGFATGGVAKVRGSGGTDSQHVQFMATPGETLMVLTPAQKKAMERGGDTEINNIHNNTVIQNIQTPEVNSMRQARRQIANDQRRGLGMN